MCDCAGGWICSSRLCAGAAAGQHHLGRPALLGILQVRRMSMPLPCVCFTQCSPSPGTSLAAMLHACDGCPHASLLCCLLVQVLQADLHPPGNHALHVCGGGGPADGLSWAPDHLLTASPVSGQAHGVSHCLQETATLRPPACLQTVREAQFWLHAPSFFLSLSMLHCTETFRLIFRGDMRG